MAHWLCTGMSRCGKSSLMKTTIIPAHQRAGRWVAVLDPIGASWPANWVTADPAKFAASMSQAKNCVGIIDEFACFRGDFKNNAALERLFFMGGNFGNLFYAMAQRLMMVPPNVRSQCDNAIIFQQTTAGLIDLAAQYNQPSILECATLPKYHAMIVAPFQPPRIIVTPAP